MKKTKTNKEGFAKSKKNTHGKEAHPVYYKKKSRKSDELEYVTFTHSKEILLNNGQKIVTEDIDNINPSERVNNKKSHVVPIVYEGKRSSLGESISEYSLTANAKKRIEHIFMNAPRKKAPKKLRKK